MSPDLETNTQEKNFIINKFHQQKTILKTLTTKPANPPPPRKTTPKQKTHTPLKMNGWNTEVMKLWCQMMFLFQITFPKFNIASEKLPSQ